LKWSNYFVEDRTHDGRKYRMLNVIDEFTDECLAIRINRRLKAIDIIDVLSDLFILRGVPGHIRSDNGPEFVAKAVQEWVAAVGTKTAYVELGSRITGKMSAPGINAERKILAYPPRSCCNASKSARVRRATLDHE
jgi:transposase InsO family protein